MSEGLAEYKSIVFITSNFNNAKKLYHQKNEDEVVVSLAANPDFTPLKAYSFLLFVLLYFPCIATIATLRREIGRGWATFSVVFSIVLAWLVAFGVFQIGSLL